MGKKRDELSRRLQEGLPVAETPTLLKEAEEEKAREQAPEVNPLKYKDPHAQLLSNLWFSQRETATTEQKKQGRVSIYLKRVGTWG